MAAAHGEYIAALTAPTPTPTPTPNLTPNPNPDPNPNQVAAAHGEYIAALTALFERHKVEAYGEEEASGLSLELW